MSNARSNDPLTLDRLKQILCYDSETGQFSYRVRSRGQRFNPGYVNESGYVRITIDGVRYYAHRLAWLYVHGVWPPKVVDHINGNTSDNRIANLRPADQGLNNGNSKRRKDNTSGARGVSYRNDTGKWTAYIWQHGKRTCLGCYDDKSEAIAVYQRAAEQRFGEFQRQHV